MEPNPYHQDDFSEELSRKILQAASAAPDEIEAAANSPFLFQRIRNQIATEANMTQQATAKNSLFSLFNWRWGWAIPAAAILLFGFVLIANKTNSVPPLSNEIAKSEAPKTIEKVAGEQPALTQITNPVPQKISTVKASYRPSVKRTPLIISPTKTVKIEAAEEVTDFLPLTYLSEATASDSGHVVRVEVPRTMMASMGVPTNQERQAEFVKADVIIGDDGLARAIRFVQ